MQECLSEPKSLITTAKSTLHSRDIQTAAVNVSETPECESPQKRLTSSPSRKGKLPGIKSPTRRKIRHHGRKSHSPKKKSKAVKVSSAAKSLFEEVK